MKQEFNAQVRQDVVYVETMRDNKMKQALDAWVRQDVVYI